jgi:hypothetical protein
MALADGKEKKSFERPRSGQVWASVGEKRGTDLTGCKMQIRVTLHMHFLNPMGNESSAFQLALRGCWALRHFLVSYPPIEPNAVLSVEGEVKVTKHC